MFVNQGEAMQIKFIGQLDFSRSKVPEKRRTEFSACMESLYSDQSHEVEGYRWWRAVERFVVNKVSS